ncbi:MAG: Ig-like domain-containing protein [Planctomycetota bacterium]
MRILAPVAALCVVGAGCDDSDDDIDDFVVISMNPADTVTNVSTNTQIVLRFNTTVDPNSYSGNQQIIVVDQSNSQIPISITPTPSQPASEFLTITPATPLAVGQTYGVAVREFVKALGGEQIAAPYAGTFSTGATLATIPGFPPFLVPNPAPPSAGPPGTFTLAGQLQTARSRHQSVLLQSRDVAVFGGVTGGRAAAGGTVLRSAEIYNRTSGTWASSNSNNGQGMAFPRYGHTATLLDNGKVMIAGGGDERAIWDTAEIYDPLNDGFSPTATTMQNSRQYHTASRIANGNVLLAGGFSMSIVLQNFAGGSNSAIIANTIEVYDVPSGTFILSTQSLNREKMYHTATTLPSGEVMFAGGYVLPFGAAFWCPTTRLCDIYNPDTSQSAGNTGTLFATGSLAIPRMNHTATLYTSGNAQGLAVIVAGYETSPFNALLQSAEVYDPNIPINNGLKGDFALVAANMSQGRRAHTTTILNTGADAGKLLIVGGATSAPTLQPLVPPAPPHFWPSTESHSCGTCQATATAERFDPFGSGQSLLLPYRGVDITGSFDWTRDQTPATQQTMMVGTSNNPVNVNGRYYHTAETLPTGHVLLVGGWDCPFCSPFAPPTFSGAETPLSTVELYNP